MKNKHSVLLLTQSGSFHTLGRQLVRLFSAQYEINACEWQKAAGQAAEVVVVLWWHPAAHGLPGAVRASKTVVGCVFDSHSWTVTAKGRDRLRQALRGFDVLVVGNEAILDALRQAYKRLPPAFVCETGADLASFRPSPTPATFTAMWCGNSLASDRDYDLKGVRIIEDACQSLGVPLQIADSAEEKGPKVSRRDMPDWYRQGSVYVCASRNEGTPRPVLEALASGRPVVTTRVGVVSRLIHHGINGCIVGRDPQRIADGLTYMRHALHHRTALVGAAARGAAIAWGEHQMASRWSEVLSLATGGTWWKGLGALPVAPVPEVLLTKKGRRPNRLALERREMEGHFHKPEELQGLVDELEARKGVEGKRSRPVVQIASTYRFVSRTLHLLEHLVHEYRFTVGRPDDTPKADLAWAFYPFTDGEWCQAAGIPYVLSMRGQFWHMGDQIIERAVKVYEGAQYITTLTDSLHRDLIAGWPQLRSIPHKVIHNGNSVRRLDDTRPAKLGYPKPIILCVTNFHFQGKLKAVEEMSKALDQVGFRGTFLVAAQPPPSGKSHPKMHRGGVYHGFSGDRMGLYGACDVFLYHSMIDGQPTSLIEAMSAGMPCVVSRREHSGAAEFIQDKVTGRLFDDPRQGAAIALQLLAVPVEAKKYGRAARQWVWDNCSWCGAAIRYDKVFQEVLTGKGK